MACDINVLVKLKESLLSKGYSEEHVALFLKLYAMKNSDNASELESTLNKTVTETSPLSSEQRTDLKNIVDKLVTRIERTVGSVTELNDRIDKVIDKLLSIDEKERLYRYLEIVQVANGNIQGSGSDFISVLKDTIAIHEAKGNKAEAAALREKLKVEEEKAAKYEENQQKRMTERDKLLVRLENLKKLANLIQAATQESLTDEEITELKRIQDSKLKQQDAKNKVTEAKTLVKNLKDELKKLDKNNDAYKQTKIKLEEAKKNLKNAEKELSLLKVADEVLPKKLTDKKDKLNSIFKTIQKEINKTREKINNVDSKSFAQVIRKVKKDLTEKVARESKAIRDIRYGYKQRMELIDSYAQQLKDIGEKEVQIHIPFMTAIIGNTPVDNVLKSREKIKLDDGTLIQDDSPLTVNEAKEALRKWKSLMLNNINNGFYSTDLSVINEENLNHLKAIASGQEIVDLSANNILDSIIVPTMLPEQAMSRQTLGVTPEDSRAQTAKQLASWLESTITTLESLKTASNFKGTINEAFLRIAMHQRLFHIASTAFASTLQRSRKKRIIDTGSTDTIEAKKNILRKLGLDTTSMPEYNQLKFPDWETDFSRVIGFDIEANGLTDDSITGIYSIQLTIYKDGEYKKIVWMNTEGSLTNALDRQEGTKDFLNTEHIETILNQLEQYQQEGYKVVSHNGNGYDFKNLAKFVDNKQLLARVAIRSIDTQANLGFDNRVVDPLIAGPYPKRGPKGARLKDLAQTNLPKKSVAAYDGRITFTNGTVLFNNPVSSMDIDGTEKITYEPEELVGSKVSQYWEEGLTGDWTKFLAYASNDTDLTVDLVLHFAKQDRTTVRIFPNGVGGSGSYEINTFKPRSNLFLDETEETDNELKFFDIVKDIIKIVPELVEETESIHYNYELEYNLDGVIGILQDWLIQAWSLDPDNRTKVELINKGLEQQDLIVNQQNNIIIELSKENRRALQYLLKKKFDKFGYIDNLNLDPNKPGRLNSSVFKIDDVNNRAVEHSDGIGRMFFTIENELDYENRVLEYMSDYINGSEFTNQNQFDQILRDKFKIRQRLRNESNQSYYGEVIPQLLKKYIEGFNRISDFGNSNIDWKPAYDVGIAIVQLVLDRRPGIVQQDNILINGDTIVNGMSLSGTSAVYQGRAKNFIIPNKDRVSFISPFSPVTEERSYDNFRLIERIKFALSYDFSDPAKLKEFMTWAETPQEMNRKDAISYFVTATKNTVFPDIRSRSPFDNLLTLNERKHLAYSYIYNIPRLLTCFNHDCAYWGLNAGGRFLKDTIPTYYVDDFMSAGAPTARAVLAGAIDQIAWMTVFNLDNPEMMAKFEESVLSAVKLLKKSDNPENLIEQTNKSDYKYSGLHISKAMLTWYNEASFRRAYEIVSQLGFDIEITDERIVPAKGLNDPRFKAVDLMIEDFNLLKTNREAYKEKFRLNDSELKAFESLVNKLQDNKEEAKEFLKGAITPRFFSAGFKGIYEGLLNKNKEKDLGFSVEEVKVATKVLLRELVNQHAVLIDQATVLSSKNIKDIKEIFLNQLTGTIDPSTIKNTYDSNFFNEQTYEVRLKQMQSYFNSYVSQVAESLVPKFGIVQREKEVEKIKAELIAEYQDRMEQAAEIFTSKDLKSLTPEQYAEVQTKVNQIFAGSLSVKKDDKTGKLQLIRGTSNGADQYLALWALNRRAGTPFKLLSDNIELQRAVTGVHITTDDFQGFLNRAIFHTYGMEVASGRNHMFGNWGNGPESSKLAQVRVEGGKEANPLGIWDIQDIKWSEDEFNQLYATQLMLDLLPYYSLPGYNTSTESRENYWSINDQRSIEELKAQAYMDYLLTKDDAFLIPRFGMTAKQLRSKVEQYAGNPDQRFRLRTLASDSPQYEILMSMDASVEGLGSYRPLHADMDFTQRSIFGLLEAQFKIKKENTRENRLINRIKEIKEKTKETENPNPNEIIPQEHRGFVSIYDKKNLPVIPAQTGDTVSSIIFGPKTIIEQKAIKIKNRAQAFARAYGWDQLYDQKDWTRLFFIQQLHYRSYKKVLKLFEEEGNDLSVSTKAKVLWFDGFFKSLGIKSKAFLQGKNFSTIDLMLRKEDIGVSTEDIKYLKSRFPDGVSWLQVLVYLSKKLDRLEGIKVGVTLQPGIVVRAEPGLTKSPTRAQPNNIHGVEVRVLYSVIMASEATRIAATDYLKAQYPAIYDSMKKENKVDSNGYVLLEGMPLDEKIISDVLKIAMQNKKALARELASKFRFIVSGPDIDIIPYKKEQPTTLTGPIQVEIPGLGLVKVNTTVDNPNTLWAFTEDMLVEMLNSLENNDLFANVELAYQTNKAIATETTDLDVLIQEQEKQQFADMAANEEETFDSLMLLHLLEVDPDSAKPLTILDYRKKDTKNNPKIMLDMPSYFTQSIPLVIANKRVFATLEEAVYLTDIMQVRKIAEMKGMDEELKAIDDFLLTNLTTGDPNVTLTEDSPFTQQSIPTIKLTALLYQMKNSIDNLNKRDSIINFVQPGLSKESRQKILTTAINISNIMARVTNTNKGENSEFYYIAAARFEKMMELDESILSNKNFENMIIQSTGQNPNEKNKRLASSAILKAFKDYRTIPQGMNFETTDIDFRSNVAQFADKDKFIEAFGNDGENIVNQLSGMVTNGIITQKVMDMKLIMLGSLALSNKNILTDLHIEATDTSGPSMFATAAKKGTKYTIGLNIKAMAVTQDNEILLKFAEELVHIARIKYLNVNNADYQKLIGVFNTARSEEMIREMLLAMGKNKPYDMLEQDVKYAMKNPDEFLAHFGAMILLQQTIYNPEVLNALEAKYEAVFAAKTWWARAFYNIKQLAKLTVSKFAQLKSDPYYEDVYKASYSIIQNLLFNSYPSGRIDVNNPDMQFNASQAINTTQKQLDQTQKEAIRELRKNGLKLEEMLKDPRLDPSTRADYISQLAEINGKLQNPEFNPNNVLDMSEAEIQEQLESKVQRNTTTGQIILRSRPDITTRALISEALNNWSKKRGSRVDNKDTIAGMIRMFPDQKDRVTRLFQNFLFVGFNQTNLTYNSGEALAVMLSDLIDNWTVTTQDTYRPSLTSGGFMANKLALDGYMGNLRYRTSAVARQFSSRDIRERINNDVIRQLHGINIASTDTQEVEAVNLIAKAFKLWHRRLGEEMVNARIIATNKHLDPVGLKLKDAKLLTQSERSKGFAAIRNLIKNKILKQLDTVKEASIISPYILFVGGLLPSPDEKFGSDESSFRNEYIRFASNPNEVARNAKEAIVKLVILQAIDRLVVETGVSTSVAMGQIQGSSNLLAETQVQNAIRNLIYSTRQHQTTFAEALSKLNRNEIDMVLKEYRNLVASDTPTINGSRLFAAMNNSDFGFYMGETRYGNEYKGANHVLDAMTYEFLGKLGATAYMFDTRSSFLTSADIFLNEDPTIADDVALARAMFDSDVDSIAFSLLRGVGYDAVQRILVEQVSGIPGFTFTFQQLIDQIRGVVASDNPESKIRQVINLDEAGNQEERKHTILLALERLSEANKDARGTLGYRSSGIPLVDALVKGGRIATQLSFGPNIGLATWLVEGGMGAVAGTVRGDNPIKFLIDAIDQNVRSFVTTTGDVVRRRDNKLQLFNVDPPLMKSVARNCLWLFEEMYSPMLPGKLTGDGLDSEIIERMSTWERFVTWQSRSQSGAMKAIRIASENQGNRRIVKDIQNRNLFRLRDSINKILRGNPNPSNAVLRQVIEDAGVSYNIEVLLAFIRAGLFETVETTHDGKTVSKIGVLETIDYMISNYQLDRGTLPMIEFFSEEENMQESIIRKHGDSVINQSAIRAARTAMMKSMKSYANMAMVMQHPLDGTASATGHHVILNFYRSYPALFTAQFLMRRGSITPAMQFGFELLLYSMLDLSYNILLSLASGYYQYEKIKRALETREINNREVIRLLLKYPVFSSNLIGLGMQNIIPVLMGGINRDTIISSVAESAIGYDIRNVIKALQGWSSYAMGEIPQQHPALSTYNVLGRVIPGIGNTLVKMLLMQAFGELNTSGRTRKKRTNTSYVMDKIDALSDQAIREQAIRAMFKTGTYTPAGAKLPTGGYQSLLNVPKAKLPEVKEPQLNQPQVLSEPSKDLSYDKETTPGLVEQATTPIKAPM